MSGIHLNDLSKIYREQIVEKKDDTYLEPDMKKRQANNEKARKELAKGPQMKNPHFEEVEVDEAMSSYDRNRKRAAQRAADRNAARASGKTGVVPGVGYVSPRKERETYTDEKGTERHKSGAKMEGLDPVNPVAANKKFANRQDKDLDNDGDTDTTDKYLHKRRKAIGKAIKKKMSEGVRDIDPEKGTAERKARLEKKRGMKMDDHPQYKKEEFIPEVMSDDMDEKPIKEKKVKNVVKINPKLGESVEEIGGELIEAVEIVDILEEITDQELRFISDKMIDEIVEEFFIEAAEQDDDLEVLQQNLCESIDLSISLLLEQDAGAEARKRLGSGPSRASVMDRVKSAVKKHGPTVKAGLKKAGKAVAKGAGYAAGAAVRGAKAAGREFSKGYERGRQGSSGSSDSSSSDSGSSSSSSDSGSSSAPKKPGLLSRIGAKLKKGIGKAARAVSRGARNVARKMDEAVYGGTPAKKEAPKDTRMVVTNADKKANTPAYQKMKAGDKRYKAADHMGEGYGAPGHNPGSGEKSVARAKALMDKKGQKGAPGLDAMMAAKKEHEARRGVKKEELENIEELHKGKHGQSDKEYMDSRSDAGKQISGDSKMSGAAYSHRSFKGQGKPAKPGERQKAQGRMTQADRNELAIRKANLKKEEMSPQEIQMQKKKATIDKMIAMKRKQQLDKSKAEPTKAMGEAKELSVDDQMRISREANAKRKPYQPGDRMKQRAAQIKQMAKSKDTRTDAQKMTDATGPRPGSRYRGD